MRRLVLLLALLWPAGGAAIDPDVDAAATAAFFRGDAVTAITLLHPSAKAGDAKAQNAIGYMYASLNKDREAVKWYRLAAEQGLSNSQSFLGDMYANGRGVPKDFVRAYAWYSISVAPGDAEHSKKLRDNMRGQMTPAQIAEARKLSRELCAKIPKCAK